MEKKVRVRWKIFTGMGKRISVAAAMTELYRRIEHQYRGHARLDKVARSKAPWSKQLWSEVILYAPSNARFGKPLRGPCGYLCGRVQ